MTSLKEVSRDVGFMLIVKVLLLLLLKLLMVCWLTVESSLVGCLVTINNSLFWRQMTSSSLIASFLMTDRESGDGDDVPLIEKPICQFESFPL